MVKVEQKNGGFLLEGKVLVGASVPSEDYINLAWDMGEDIDYSDLPYKLLDYPGEYDIDGIVIKCLEGKNAKLNYLIFVNGKDIGIIQSSEVLDKDEVGDMAFWLYTDEKIANKIDHMEMEGEKQKLEQLIISNG